jgi:prepilin-type N-terminal cleavage/methylation domain-containing protein
MRFLLANIPSATRLSVRSNWGHQPVPSYCAKDTNARRGFSLIELLIVVTIISILASIAVPNFLEAQVRSKVSRVKADMRSMTTAIESYHVDNNGYPVRRNTNATVNMLPSIAETSRRLEQLSRITTPIAYISYLPSDIFESHLPPPNNVIDYYDQVQVLWLTNSLRLTGQVAQVKQNEVSWMMISVGPDGYLGAFSDAYTGVSTPFQIKGTMYYPYDPTNGSVSTGNIYNSGNSGLDNAGAKFMDQALRR